jgi:hypothetical protein
MKKFLLATTAAMIAAAYVGSATAADFDATPPTFDTYASERIVSGAVLGGASIQHKLGFGVSANNQRYLRYDLTNATFATKVVFGDLTVPGGATVAVAQGGNVGEDYVILTFTAGADIAPEEVVSLAITSLKVTDKGTSVTGQAALYESGNGAQNESAADLLYKTNGTVLAIASGLQFATTPLTTVASVVTEFKEFKQTPTLGAADGWIAADLSQIGKLTHQVKANTLDENGAPLTMVQLTAAGTKVVVTGDFSNATKVFFSAPANCAAESILATLNAGKTEATIVVDTAEVLAAANSGICYTADTTKPQIVQTFTITAEIVPATGADTADQGPLVLGDHDRDGTVLKTAFAETRAGSYSGTVNLANTGTKLAKFSTRCLTTDGSVDGSDGEVEAGKAARFGITAALGLNCPAATVRGLELTFDVV